MKQLITRPTVKIEGYWIVQEEGNGDYLWKDGTLNFYSSDIEKDEYLLPPEQKSGWYSSEQEALEAIAHYYLNNKEEVTYSVGDVFDPEWGDKECVWMLCEVNENKVNFVNIGDYSTGLKWHTSDIEVKNINKITKDELSRCLTFKANQMIKRERN